jgi:hypothetical protein
MGVADLQIKNGGHCIDAAHSLLSLLVDIRLTGGPMTNTLLLAHVGGRALLSGNLTLAGQASFGIRASLRGEIYADGAANINFDNAAFAYVVSLSSRPVFLLH